MDMSNVLVLMISFGMLIHHVRKQKMIPHVLRKAT